MLNCNKMVSILTPQILRGQNAAIIVKSTIAKIVAVRVYVNIRDNILSAKIVREPRYANIIAFAVSVEIVKVHLFVNMVVENMTAENARGLDSVNMITEGILAHSAGNDVYMDAERPYARIAMAPGFVNTLGCAITAGIAVEVESVLMVNAASGVRIVRNSVQSPYHQYLYNKNNLSNIYQEKYQLPICRLTLERELESFTISMTSTMTGIITSIMTGIMTSTMTGIITSPQLKDHA
jgi:hypothetical protein